MSRILMPSALALAIFAVSNAHAADTTQANNGQQLPLIVVTASKTPEAIEKVPARISVIDEKTIQQSPVTDLPHLLQQEAALNVVQSGGMGQQTSTFTRGTNSNHTLVLKNGVRINPATSGIPNIQFLDTTDLAQIEVLKGPASVQYGSDAIGGVVNLITATPKKQRLFTTIQGGEQNTYKTIVGADLVQDDAYFQIRGQRLETDGSAILSDSNIDNSYDQKGFSAKGGIDNEHYAISLEAAQNKGTGQYLGYNATTFAHNRLTAQDFVNRQYSLKGRYNILSNLGVNARISRSEDELDQLSNTDFAHTQHDEADININWGFTQHQNILLGVTQRNTDADYKSGFNAYDKTLKTTGYYLQHQYQDDSFSTQAGVRIEDDKQFGSHTVGQLGVRYFVAPTTSIYTNIGSAFRAPEANQLYAGSSANADLKPEESKSFEIGIDHQLGYGFNTYFSAYHTKVKNLITSICLTADDCTNFVFKNVNTNKATLSGSELGLKWKQNAWFSSLEYAYVRSEDTKTKQQLLRRPRQTVTLTAGWDNGTYGLNTSIVAKGRSKDFADWPSTTLSNTPGFVSGNINAFWQYNPNVKLFANVQNIGDTHYKTAYDGGGIYYIAAERLATAGVTLSY